MNIEDEIITATFGPLTLVAQFDTRMRSITQERGKDYGHPADDFAIAHQIKDALRACPDPLIRHALEMISVKMARLCTSPGHLDSWIDIGGYARTAVMILDRQREQGGA
jgi:hypothetical protein